MKFLQTIFNTIGILAVIALAWALGSGYVPLSAPPEPSPQSSAIEAPHAESKSTQTSPERPVQPSSLSQKPAAFPIPTGAEKTFHAEYFSLENGLEIVVIPSHRVPVVTHMVWYRVGAADEQPGVSGIAHFLEHLMFKGSGDLKPGEFSQVIRALGGNDNAFTSQDYTAYFQSISKDHLETVMRMEAGRMRGLNIARDEVRSERDVILEERRQRVGNNPQAQLGEHLDAALYPNHNYGIPVLGWEHEMAQLDYEDAVTFYNRWYGPNNAILVVSGDVTGTQVYELAQKIYGPLASVPVPQRQRTEIPALAGETRIVSRDKQVQQPMIQKSIRAPSYRQDAKTSLALDVLQEIMGGGSSARLYHSLVADQKIAVSAGMSYRSGTYDDGEVSLYASPVPGQDLETLERALDEELRKLISGGLKDGELQEAIKRLQAAAVFARDSLSGPAMIFGQALATGSGIDDIEYWSAFIAQVTEDDVIAAAKIWLNPDNESKNPPVIGYLLPAESSDHKDQKAEEK